MATVVKKFLQIGNHEKIDAEIFIKSKDYRFKHKKRWGYFVCLHVG